jgi:energy-coupling factor transport system ATP-binding protein
VAGSPDRPPIRLRGVRLTYDEGSTWALAGIDLDVAAGERLCVLGANGSGKSTLASVLCGLLAPDGGTVELAGRTVFSDGTPDPDAYRAARRDIGLVFQNPEDQIVTTVVADDVAFGPENLGMPRGEICRRVDRELGRVAMGAYAQADPTHLSGGQQQRVALAGALAMGPSVLVLDEPGASLDVRGRAGIMHVLDELAETDVTTIHITHFVDEALSADRVLVLDHGHVALEGTPEEVFSHGDELLALGLTMPFAARLSHALRDRSVDVPSTCDDEVLLDAVAHKGIQAAERHRAPTGPQVEPAQADTVVELDHVSFSYGTRPAVDDLTLALGKGELVALVGQTGSGKSTLAHLVCALAMPDRGNVRICGVDTHDRRRRRELRGHVGYVMQHPERQLFAQTIAQDVAFGPTNLGLDAQEVSDRVTRTLEFLGISDLADSSPFEVSGGQQRLAAIAGTLASDPDVLVLDEPTSGLDPRGAAHVTDLVRRLHQGGRTILLVSHSMETVAELADRVCVLDDGRMCLDDTPAEVFSHGDELTAMGLGVPSPLAWARLLDRRGHAGPPLAPGGRGPLTIGALADAIAGRR